MRFRTDVSIVDRGFALTYAYTGMLVNSTQNVLHIYMKTFLTNHYIYILQETDTMFFFLPSDCGGVLTEDNGEILSPNFPNNYNHSDACAWLILAPEGAKIQVLNFSVSH